jgi:hypothetical protein
VLLQLLEACSASSVQVNGLDFRNSLKKGSALSASLEMKRLRAANDPVSFWTSLIRAGGLIASIALIFSGFASMPRYKTRNPAREFPLRHLARQVGAKWREVTNVVVPGLSPSSIMSVVHIVLICCAASSVTRE